VKLSDMGHPIVGAGGAYPHDNLRPSSFGDHGAPGFVRFRYYVAAGAK
jgi:hypothetical protein